MVSTTGVSYDSYGFEWAPLSCEGAELILPRIEQVLAKWNSTPYFAGQQSVGQGVDCVRFVCAVLDDLYGVKNEIPREVQDVALHDPRKALKITRRIQAMYPDHELLNEKVRKLEPGDVVVAGQAQGGPGHAIFVGPNPNTMWQALKKGVRMCGFGFISYYQQPFFVGRPNKQLWLPTTAS